MLVYLKPDDRSAKSDEKLLSVPYVQPSLSRGQSPLTIVQAGALQAHPAGTSA